MQFRRLDITTTTIGIIVGTLILLRWIITSAANTIFDSDQAFDVFVLFLAVMIILTGILHTADGLEKRRSGSEWLGTGFFLGIFEIGIGMALLVTPGVYNPVLYWLAAAWAIFSGAVMFIQVLRVRTLNKQSQLDVDVPDSP
jgi:uncharacterized membrane protein HdeD (DUF308 family)